MPPSPISGLQGQLSPTLSPLCHCRTATLLAQVSQHTPCVDIRDNSSYGNLNISQNK